MDVSQGLVCIDGKVSAFADATLPASERGYHFGDGVFESFRSWGGRLPTLEEHLGRLQQSAKLLGIQMPTSISALRSEVLQLGTLLPNQELYVRIVCTRTTEGLGPDPGRRVGRSRRAIFVLPLGERMHLSETLLRASLVELPQLARPDPLRAVKCTSYAPSLWAMQQARRAGTDEALLISADGILMEAASSNVFLCHEGRLLTPSLTCGILAGITRARVLRLARTLGVTVEENRFTREALWLADEVFLTSALRGLQAIVQVDEHEVGEGKEGKLTARLKRELSRDLGVD